MKILTQLTRRVGAGRASAEPLFKFKQAVCVRSVKITGWDGKDYYLFEVKTWQGTNYCVGAEEQRYLHLRSAYPLV